MNRAISLHQLGPVARAQARRAMRAQTELALNNTDAKVTWLQERARVSRELLKRQRSTVPLFTEQLRQSGLPEFVTEHHFALKDFGREWRFDFACLPWKIAVEIEGLRVEWMTVVRRHGTQRRRFVTGRHTTVEGYEQDCVKYAHAVQLGWSVLRFTQTQITSGLGIDLTKQTFLARGWTP